MLAVECWRVSQNRFASKNACNGGQVKIEAGIEKTDPMGKKNVITCRTDLIRCPWPKSAESVDYHDREWGVPVHEDRMLFEFLILEGAQAGLSWETVLKKRATYRSEFDDFDPAKVARYNKRKTASLLGNPGLIRNRLKIESAVTNAQAFCAVQDEFGSFDDYIWQFVDGQSLQPGFSSVSDVPARTSQSDAMSKDLKRKGFRFVGSTICYAFMQAVGMTNDHLTDCFRHAELMPRRPGMDK